MATLVITNPTLSNPADKTEVQENFTDVTDWANGNISNDNISGSAGIALSKLAAQYQEVYVHLSIASPPGAASSTLPCAVVAIPGSNGDTLWKATDVSWVCTDLGTQTGVFKVEYGSYDALGAWTGTTVVTGITLNGATNNLGFQGKALENGDVSVAYSGTAISLGLFITTLDAQLITGGSQNYLNVCVRLRRALQVD